jgi:hypothetical protein
MDLNGMWRKAVGWINLVQDMNNWCAFVNVVRNPRVP